jgi:hypothetical protein
MADVSPEVLDRLADLIKAAGSIPSHGPILIDYIKSLTELLNATAWPVAVIICMLLFRQQLAKFLGDVKTIKILGSEISREIDTQVAKSAQEAQIKPAAELSSGPSEGELKRAVVVKKLAADADSELIVNQANSLAAEYLQVRNSMAPDNARTRAMEVVVSKMRT